MANTKTVIFVFAILRLQNDKKKELIFKELALFMAFLQIRLCFNLVFVWKIKNRVERKKFVNSTWTLHVKKWRKVIMKPQITDYI